jgi:hypothetical protein
MLTFEKLPMYMLSAINIMPGMVKSISRLLMEVNDIESATFPLSKYVIRFEVAPPGHADINIIPTLNSGLMDKKETIAKAMAGKITIWQTKPTSSARGKVNTFLKSFRVNDNPRLNIITAITAGSVYVEIISFCIVQI